MLRLPSACVLSAKFLHPAKIEILFQQTHKRFLSGVLFNFLRSDSIANQKSLLDSSKCCLANQFCGLKTENAKTVESKNSENQNLIFTIPNLLTSLRILAIPFINYFVLVERHDLACGLFVAASLTDFLDGYIARNMPNQRSYLGSILDPLADKLLVGSLTVTLALNHMLPLALAGIILARDFALIVASLVVRYKSLQAPITFEKFVNVKKYSNIQVEADTISKLNTALQLSLISLTLPSVLFGYAGALLLTSLQYITGTTTILSSVSYLYKRGSYKIVNQKIKAKQKD